MMVVRGCSCMVDKDVTMKVYSAVLGKSHVMFIRRWGQFIINFFWGWFADELFILYYFNQTGMNICHPCADKSP